MNYSIEKYNSLLFETQRNEFDKNIKSDKIYTALETLRNLSYYNRLLQAPDDIDMIFHTFSNFFCPVITQASQGVPIYPTEVISAISIDLNGNTTMIKLVPKVQYNAIGIFIPYNPFLINAFDPVKPVSIDFRSGINHHIYRGGNSREVILESSKNMLGGNSKILLEKTPATLVSKKKDIKVEIQLPKENVHGKFVYFSKSNDPFGEAFAILSSLEARNVSWVKDPVLKNKMIYDVKTIPTDYKGSNIIPDGILQIAKKVLGIRTFSSWEDLATQLKQSGKFIEFFQNINGIKTSFKPIITGTNLNYDEYFKERLLIQRKSMTRNERELNELYRKDELATNPLFAELNKYIIAIKGRRINFLKARPTEFDELLCQHYIDMKNHLLLEKQTSDADEDGRWIDKIVEKYGNSLDRTDGIYCSICGEVIVLEHNFLSFREGFSNPTSIVPREITDIYYEDAFRLLNTYMFTEMNVKTLVDNIIVRIYPLILEAIEDFPEDKAGIDAHITMYYLAALASLSILEPDIITFKSFRDGTKKLSGNAGMQQKLIVNEAITILVASKKSAIKASVFQSESSYKFKMDTEAFPKVHTLFSSLSSGVGVIQNEDNEKISTLSTGDLDGYNFYSAVKKMDNIVGGDGTILSIVKNNFENTKSISSQELLKGIWPEPTLIPKSKAALLYDSNGNIKNKNINELIIPEILTENQKHELFKNKKELSWGLDKPIGLYDFKPWYIRKDFISQTVTVSNMSHISSYGIIKDKKPEVYFCLDYGDHSWEDTGSVCTICGYEKGTKEVKADPKLSRMLEFYNIFSSTCPENGADDEPDESLIGDSKHSKSKHKKKQNRESQENVGSKFHIINNDKCIKCSFSIRMDTKSKINYFKKYKHLLPEQIEYRPERPCSSSPISKGHIDKEVFKRMDQALNNVVKVYKIKSRQKIEALLDKPTAYLNAILISYFNYNGELYYYDDSDEDKALYAKILILEGMAKNKQRGDSFLKDEAMLGLVVIDNPDSITGGEEADDVTLDNGEDEIEDESDEIFDLALDEEDRFDQADAE